MDQKRVREGGGGARVLKRYIYFKYKYIYSNKIDNVKAGDKSGWRISGGLGGAFKEKEEIGRASEQPPDQMESRGEIEMKEIGSDSDREAR